MSVCMTCGSNGRRECNLNAHVKDARKEERKRALYVLQVEANRYPADSEVHKALLEAMHSLDWSYR